MLFDDSRLFEGFIGSVLFDILDRLGRDLHNEGLVEFRNVDTLFLKVRETSSFSGRVELGRTGSVTVTSANLRPLVGNRTCS